MKRFVIVLIIVILTTMLTACTGQHVTLTDSYIDGNNTVHIKRTVMEVDNHDNVISSKEEPEELIYNVSLEDFLAGNY